MKAGGDQHQQHLERKYSGHALNPLETQRPAPTLASALPPEQDSGNTALYTRVKPKNERDLTQTQHQEPVQEQEQSAEKTRPEPAPRKCNQQKLVKTPDDDATLQQEQQPDPVNSAQQVETSDDNATLQQEQQPDPVCTLAKLLTSSGVKLTSTDNAKGMICKFASHVKAKLTPMESLAEKKRYLTHTRLLLGSMSSRLNALPPDPVTKPSRDEALQAISTYTSSIDNDLEGLEQVLKKQKNVRK